MISLRTPHLAVDVDVAWGAQFTHVGPDKSRNLLAFYDWASPLPASASLSYGDDRLDWLSRYRGGWQELLPNAGAACVVDDVPLPFHGEVSSAPWQVLEADERRVRLRCPTRLPLVVEREVELRRDAPTMLVREHVVNTSDRPVAMLWGHHPAWALPAGTHIDLPSGVTWTGAADNEPARSGLAPGGGVWPRALDPTGREVNLALVPDGPVSRVCFLTGGSGWYALRPPGEIGVALAWDRETFPAMWLWQEVGSPGFPTYGRARITALEPARAPAGDGLAAAIQRGEALTIPSGGRHDTWLTCTLVAAGSAPVSEVGRDGQLTVAV